MEEIGSAAMLATKSSVGVAPEVKLREHITHMPPLSVNRAAHSGFETQRRCHEKSKTVAQQKRFMFSNFFLKKRKKSVTSIIDLIQSTMTNVNLL